MELSILLSKQIIVQFLMLAVGFILIKCKALKSDDATAISKLVLYVISPCAIFNSFRIEFTDEVKNGLILAFAVSLFINFFFIFFSKFISKPFHLDTVEEMTLAYPNSGNLILPIVLAVLGQEWTIYCCAYIIIQNVLIFAHCESRICGETKIEPMKILMKPCIISIIIAAAFFLCGLEMPTIINNTLDGFGAMLAPASMLVIGMAIGTANFKEIFTDPKHYFVCFLRLIAYPMIILLLIKITNLCAIFPDAKSVLLIPFLAAASSPAATVTQMAQCHGNNPAKASALNTMSVCFLIITMPVMVMLYQLIL